MAPNSVENPSTLYILLADYLFYCDPRHDAATFLRDCKFGQTSVILITKIVTHPATIDLDQETKGRHRQTMNDFGNSSVMRVTSERE